MDVRHQGVRIPGKAKLPGQQIEVARLDVADAVMRAGGVQL